MPLAITEEQHQLAAAVREFAARHAPRDKVRTQFATLAAGQLPSWWTEFVDIGFPAVHVPETFGGQGGSLADMACVLEAAATALLPGPWLSTATAAAVALSGDITDDDGAETALARFGRRRHCSRRAARAFRFSRPPQRSGLVVDGIFGLNSWHLFGSEDTATSAN